LSEITDPTSIQNLSLIPCICFFRKIKKNNKKLNY